jgi:hypothetical protein
MREQVSTWTEEQRQYFTDCWKARAEASPTGIPEDVTHEQRDCAVQLGLIPAPSMTVDLVCGDRSYHGVLSLVGHSSMKPMTEEEVRELLVILHALFPRFPGAIFEFADERVQELLSDVERMVPILKTMIEQLKTKVIPHD